MVIFILLGMMLAPGSGQGHQTVDHTPFTDVLKAYVTAGVVDYRRMKDDPRLGAYLDHLATVDPGSIEGRNDRLAFWINLYNAATLKLICDHYPVTSINDLHSGGTIIAHVIGTTAWDKKIVRVQGRVITLNDVEHTIIRPQFKDPRAHFALVCASKSCPPLRNEAYEGRRLDAQLDDQARIFLADPARNAFDVATRTADISKIFSWYERDFGGSEGDVLRALAPWLAGPIRASIIAEPTAWTVGFKDYDWSLNGY
jgi:hypothetical protein